MPAKIDLSPEWSPRQDSNTTSLPKGSQVVYRMIISMTFSDPNLCFNIIVYYKSNISKTVRFRDKVTIEHQ